MDGKWNKVYHLADDKSLIEKVQDATLHSHDYGLVPEIALFGSDEWWRAVRDGRIPTYEIMGNISRVYMAGHNDWPEFEIESGDEKTRWTRLGNDIFYKIGSKVKLLYVLQKAKKSFTGNPYQKEVISIHVQP